MRSTYRGIQVSDTLTQLHMRPAFDTQVWDPPIWYRGMRANYHLSRYTLIRRDNDWPMLSSTQHKSLLDRKPRKVARHGHDNKWSRRNLYVVLYTDLSLRMRPPDAPYRRALQQSRRQVMYVCLCRLCYHWLGARQRRSRNEMSVSE